MAHPIVQVWSGPRCEAGRVQLGAIPRWRAGQVTEAVSGAQGPVFALDRAVADASGVRAGAWLWIHHARRGTSEWPVLQVTSADGRGRDDVTVQGGSIRQALALRGKVRTINRYGPPTIAFTLAALTPTQIITQYVLTNLDTDNLAWLSLGTIDYGGTIEIGAITNWTRTQVLDAIEAATGYRIVFTPLMADAGYRIDLRDPAALAGTPRLLAPGVNLDVLEATTDLVGGATIVEPLSSASAPMGATWWQVSAITGTGPYWVTLVDPAGGPAVIREDGQCVGWYLRPNDGLPLAITDSRASDSSVAVASRDGLRVGDLASLWLTSEGQTPASVSSPTGLATTGRVVQEVSVAVPHTRSNRVPDGALRNALGLWEVTGAAFGGKDVLSRTDPSSMACRINGAVLSAATSIDIDGGTPDGLVRFGDPFLVAGTSVAATGTVTTTSAGKATVNVLPTLPAAIATDTDLAWTRAGVKIGVAVTDGTQALGAGSLALKGLTATPALASGDVLTITTTGSVTIYVGYYNFSGQTIPGGSVFSFTETRERTVNGVVSLATYTWDGPSVGSTAAGGVISIDETPRPAFLSGEVLVSLSGTWTSSTTTTTATLSGAQPAWSSTLTATAVASAPVTLAAGAVLGWSRSGSPVGGTVRVASSVTASVNIPLDLLNGYTQILSGDTFGLPAQTLYADAVVQLDANGAGTIPIRVATTAAIADNTDVTLQRVIDLAPSAFGGPLVLRLRGNQAVTPTTYKDATKFALYSPIMRVQSPDPTKQAGQFYALVQFGLTHWAAEAGQAQRGWWALWDADTETIIGGSASGLGAATPTYSPLFDTSTHTTPGSAPFISLGTVPRRVRLSIHPGGGDVGDGVGGFTFLRYVALTVVTDAALTAALVDGSFNNQLWHRAQDVLDSRRDLARYRVQLVNQAAFADDPDSLLTVGAAVRTRSAVLGRDTTLRVQRITWMVRHDDAQSAELAAVTPRLSEA